MADDLNMPEQKDLEKTIIDTQEKFIKLLDDWYIPSDFYIPELKELETNITDTQEKLIKMLNELITKELNIIEPKYCYLTNPNLRTDITYGFEYKFELQLTDDIKKYYTTLSIQSSMNIIAERCCKQDYEYYRCSVNYDNYEDSTDQYVYTCIGSSSPYTSTSITMDIFKREVEDNVIFGNFGNIMPCRIPKLDYITNENIPALIKVLNNALVTGVYYNTYATDSYVSKSTSEIPISNLQITEYFNKYSIKIIKKYLNIVAEKWREKGYKITFRDITPNNFYIYVNWEILK